MGLELTTDRYPLITSQARYPLRHAASGVIFCYPIKSLYLCSLSSIWNLLPSIWNLLQYCLPSFLLCAIHLSTTNTYTLVVKKHLMWMYKPYFRLKAKLKQLKVPKPEFNDTSKLRSTLHTIEQQLESQKVQQHSIQQAIHAERRYMSVVLLLVYANLFIYLTVIYLWNK